MLESARLALQFDSVRLQAELHRLAGGPWAQHFNTAFFEGEWSGILLRASPSDRGLYSRGGSAAESFTATPELEASPYFQEVLATFQCPLKSVRLLRLAPGSIIREHADGDLGEALGEVRIHIPVVTNPQVEFYLAGKRVGMEAGECWYLDLSLPHRVQNRGATARVHLVVDCVLNDWLRELIANPATNSHPRPAETGAAALENFSQVVFADVVLQAALREIMDLDAFLRETVRRGEERGFHFTTEDVRSAWRAGKSLRTSLG